MGFMSQGGMSQGIGQLRSPKLLAAAASSRCLATLIVRAYSRQQALQACNGQIDTLDLTSCTEAAPSGTLAQLLAQCNHNLSRLSLAGIQGVDSSMVVLSTVAQLSYLSLAGCSVLSDGSLSQLSGCNNLKELNLSHYIYEALSDH